MLRVASLTFALLALAVGGEAAADPADLARTHELILRRLGLEGGRLTKKERLGFRYREALPGRGPSRPPRDHRPRFFLPGQPVYGARELTILAKAAVEQGYSPFADASIRPVEDAAASRRAHSIYWRLGGRLSRELGLEKRALGPMLLLEGGKADRPGATSLANGSMILHRGSLGLADVVARALVSARSKREALSQLVSVVLDRAPEVAVDQRECQRIADGFLAVTVGHEMMHGLKGHVAQGRARDVVRTPFGTSSPTYRAQELVADAGGAELAMRGGYSPVGILSFYLYQTVMEAHTGCMNGPLAGTHPRSIERYRVVYRLLEKRADQQRLLYDALHAPKRGPAYLSPADRQALRQMPTPAELEEFVLSLPQGVNYLYPAMSSVR